MTLVLNPGSYAIVGHAVRIKRTDILMNEYLSIYFLFHATTRKTVCSPILKHMSTVHI